MRIHWTTLTGGVSYHQADLFSGSFHCDFICSRFCKHSQGSSARFRQSEIINPFGSLFLIEAALTMTSLKRKLSLGAGCLHYPGTVTGNLRMEGRATKAARSSRLPLLNRPEDDPPT